MIRFGLIGCGRVSLRHIQSIQDLSGHAHLAAVADVVEARAKRAAMSTSLGAMSTSLGAMGTTQGGGEGETGGRVRPLGRREQGAGAGVYTDYRRLLDRADIDVVNICTPSGLHARMAIDALQAGKHVILEKPMALSLADADQIIQAAQESGRKLSVVLQNRYNPPMQNLRRIVDEGKLGRLLLGNATVRWYRPQEYYEDGWHGTWAMDGGALMNQSIHHIDALQWLMGDVASVFAYTATLAHRMEAEDAGVVALRFRDGALGVIEGSTFTYPENLEGSIALFGERGSVKVGGTALNRKTLWRIEGELEHERELLMSERVDPPSVYGSSHLAVIADMIEAIEEDREPRTNGVEARKSVALVLAIYESARTGLPVTMPPPAHPPIHPPSQRGSV